MGKVLFAVEEDDMMELEELELENEVVVIELELELDEELVVELTEELVLEDDLDNDKEVDDFVRDDMLLESEDVFISSDCEVFCPSDLDFWSLSSLLSFSRGSSTGITSFRTMGIGMGTGTYTVPLAPVFGSASVQFAVS